MQSWISIGKIPSIEMMTSSTYGTRDAKQPGINFIQINLQHSRATTASLMKIVSEEKTDIIFIQETYTYQGRVAGIPTKFKTITSG
jgi:hypothetical protein